MFLCETGQLNESSRRALRKAGVVVVEVADPSACRFIRANEVLSGDDMLYAALKALRHVGGTYSKGSDQREQLAVNLFNLVDAARSADGAR